MDLNPHMPNLTSRLDALISSVDMVGLVCDGSPQNRARKLHFQQQLIELGAVAMARAQHLGDWLNSANHSGLIDIDDTWFESCKGDLNNYLEKSISLGAQMKFDRLFEFRRAIEETMRLHSLHQH